MQSTQRVHSWIGLGLMKARKFSTHTKKIAKKPRPHPPANTFTNYRDIMDFITKGKNNLSLHNLSPIPSKNIPYSTSDPLMNRKVKPILIKKRKLKCHDLNLLNSDPQNTPNPEDQLQFDFQDHHTSLKRALRSDKVEV